MLALGAGFKNAVCLAQGHHAWVSHTVGDLFTAEACLAHEAAARELLQALNATGVAPVAIVHDLHPDLHSTRFAWQLAAECGIAPIGIQHHHAHIAAVLAEHMESGPVLGLALDGVGMGTDGQAWGGELLRVGGALCERLGRLRPLALAGGDRAATEPWRMAAAVMFDLGRGEEIASRYAAQAAVKTVAAMLSQGVNCPRTSSMGRVFDAAAALLGLCLKMENDAQAAVALEASAAHHVSVNGWPSPLEGGWAIDADGQLDLLPLLAALCDESDAGYGAALFHVTLAEALGCWTMRAVETTGITRVVLGGGCFFNKLLSAALGEKFRGAGLDLLQPRRLPPGDTAIALGQAWAAIHLLEN